MPYSDESPRDFSNRRKTPLRLWKPPPMSLMRERIDEYGSDRRSFRDEYGADRRSFRDEYHSNGRSFGRDDQRNRELASQYAEPSSPRRSLDGHSRYQRGNREYHHEKEYHSREYHPREHHQRKSYSPSEREYAKTDHYEHAAFQEKPTNPKSPHLLYPHNQYHTDTETRKTLPRINSDGQTIRTIDQFNSIRSQSRSTEKKPSRQHEIERRRSSGTDSFSDISSSSCSPPLREEKSPSSAKGAASCTKKCLSSQQLTTKMPLPPQGTKESSRPPTETMTPPKSLSQLSRKDLEQLIPHMNDIDAKYEKISQIGEGTYGKVFKGAVKNPIGAQQYVAMKKVRMECEKEGFPITATREIKILSSIAHKNIIQLIEIVTSKGTIFRSNGQSLCIWFLITWNTILRLLSPRPPQSFRSAM